MAIDISDCICSPKPNKVFVINDNTPLPTLVSGNLTLPGLVAWDGVAVTEQTFTFPYRDIIEAVTICDRTAVAQITDLTPAIFDRGTCCDEVGSYTIEIQVVDCEAQQTITRDFSFEYVLDKTVALIVADIVTAINADSIISQFLTAANNTTKVTLTGATAGCGFTVTGNTTNITVLTTTANVTPMGQSSNLTHDNVPAAMILSGDVYDTIVITLYEKRVADLGVGNTCCDCFWDCKVSYFIYVNNDYTLSGDFLDTFCGIIYGSYVPSYAYNQRGINCNCDRS